MKSQILVAISAVLFFLVSACHKPQEISSSISFAIDGYGNDTIRLYQVELLGITKLNTQDLVVDESGSGTLEIVFPDNSFVYVRISDFVFSIFFTSGSDFQVKGKADDLSNTLTVTGEGSVPIHYTLAKNMIIKKHSEQDGRYILQLDSAEFWSRISDFTRDIDSLNIWLATQYIKPELESLLVLESQQQANAFILLYALVKKSTDPIYFLDIPYDTNLFKSFSSSYSQVLALNYELQLIGPTWENSGASYNDSIANIFPSILCDTINSLEIPEFAKDFYISRMLLSYFGENLTSPALEEVYAYWLSKFPQSIFRTTISKAIDNMSSLAPGEKAPVITGIDPNGNNFTIEDLKGQVIYIDVWATWCSGCVEKIPKMYALQEELKDHPQISFLFVSMDKDHDKWLNYISKLPGNALHINAGNTDLFKDYMMGGIPHYIIIDASGNIYQSNAPDPDSREIKSILEEAIKN